jgi:prolyl oligopeptidase
MLKKGVAAMVLPICAAMSNAADFTPPSTASMPVTETLHGVTVTDPYRWLERQNSPKTRAWIESQDRFARHYLDAIPGREQLQRKFEALLKIDVVTAPTVRNNLYFFARRLAGEDRSSLCMRRGYTGRDEVLVAPADIGQDQTASLNYTGVSEDGSIIAFGIRRGGEDETEIRLMDVATRKALPDGLPRGRYFSFSMKPDKSGYYYSQFTVGKGSRIYYHAVGTAAASDREIFGSGYGPAQNISAGLSEDGRWLLIEVAEGVPAKKTELYLQNLGANGAIQPIVKEDAEFEVEFAGRSLILVTNWKAANRRVFRADLESPSRDRWKEIVPESAQPITGSSAAGGRLFVSYLENVVTRIKQFDIDGKYLGDLKLPGIGSAFGPGGRWSDSQVFYRFTSFVEPVTTYRVMASTGQQDIWFRPKVPIRAADFETKQVWYNSKDGTRVPMFLVYRKGLTLDGKRPTLLSGYGGFNLPSTPAFSPLAAVWTELGGIYALANLRGGGEFGESWHKAGMLEKKQNVFDDFTAAAEWLIRNRYTSTATLGIEGGSNGGLLMGAMMTQRPDLFGAIICGAPLLDMLRYHKLSVGAWWVSEYGSADDPKQFEYLYRYSPYQNVRKTSYPAIMFVTGDADTRVDPSHARKMTALVQASNTADTPIILRYDTKGGHSGIGSVSKTIEEDVDSMSFLCGRLGVRVP